MGEVYEYKYKYKYKYKYGDRVGEREPYDDEYVEEPVRRRQGRYIRIRNSVGPYEKDIIRVEISYKLPGETVTARSKELERNKEHIFEIPPSAFDVRVKKIEAFLTTSFFPVPLPPVWVEICKDDFKQPITSFPFCIYVDKVSGARIPYCRTSPSLSRPGEVCRISTKVLTADSDL
jgi:hypothetical protein